MREIKRNYKDGIFRRLFGEKESLIELYNALSGGHYTNETDVEIVTLENVLFGDLKNDLAFIIDNRFIILAEHQSTVNPNMALRMLLYIAKEYERLTRANNIYSKRRIEIPAPELYVFYNGIADRPVEEELKLSENFFEKCDKIALEVIVKVINVNYEKNAELLKRSKLMADYSRFIYMIRERQNTAEDLREAVERTVDDCMKKGILADFLKKNGGDVVSVLYEALTREQCEEIRENDGYLRGLEEGEAKGELKGKEESLKSIIKNMRKMGMGADVIAEATGLTKAEVSRL